jgi:EmrB/QacA subfamily drug resistance transporter
VADRVAMPPLFSDLSSTDVTNASPQEPHVASTDRSPSTTIGATAGLGEPDPQRWLALIVIGMAQLMIILDASIVNIALPRAQAALHISDSDRAWVVTAYTLAFGGLLLLGGRIADFAGRKRVFIIGLIGFGLASALGGAAPNAALLLSARALQGAFAALLAPAALSLISVTFTEVHERARAFGVYGAISGGGAAIGLVLGGILTQYVSWRWCLFVNVPIALFAAFAAVPVVRESKAGSNTQYDIPGAITATAGLVALVYGFTKVSQLKPSVPGHLPEVNGWTNIVSLVSFAIAAVMLALFVILERRTEHPLLPMRVVLDRNRGGSYLTSLIVGLALFGMFLFLTYYFQGTLGYSPLKAGLLFLPFSGGIIVGAGVTSQLLPRIGPRILMTAGTLLAAAGMLWLTKITVQDAYLTHVLPSQILMSVGLAAVFVPLASTALIGVGNHDAGVASAMVNTTQQIGGSLGTALLNTIATSATAAFLVANGTTALSVRQAQVHGYTEAFTISAVLLLVAAAVAFVFISPGKPQVHDGDVAVAHA